MNFLIYIDINLKVVTSGKSESEGEEEEEEEKEEKLVKLITSLIPYLESKR